MILYPHLKNSGAAPDKLQGMATFTTYRFVHMNRCLPRFWQGNILAVLLTGLLSIGNLDLPARETELAIRRRTVLLHLSGAWGMGGETQLGLHGKYIQTIGRSRWYFLTGIHTRMLQDARPIMYPSSYRLRNYPEPDRLLGRDLRIWSTAWSAGLLYRITPRVGVFILPEIASVSTGKNFDFTYITTSNPDLYTPVQTGKPSPAGLINPILRLKGSLQISAGVQIRFLPHWVAVLHYQRVRYEFTTYKLLNFRNDRFMKSLDQIGIGFGYCFESR